MNDRLKEIERMAEEYEYAAECRDENVNAANYRNISQAIRNIRTEMEE